jgi:HKD family nuclease
MRFKIIDNTSQDMLSTIIPKIESSNDIKIAVAFVSYQGLKLIKPGMDKAMKAGSRIEFLVGLDFHTTEPAALNELFILSNNYNNLFFYCYGSLSPSAIYHPKLYTLRRNQDALTIIGSSNLTEGGLKKNFEINIAIEGNTNDEVISDIYDTYNRMKYHPKGVIPDEEFLSYYTNISDIEREGRRSLDKSQKKLKKAFKEKLKSLRHPEPSRSDLVGWLDLVYKFLPVNEFTNQQIYKYNDEFQKQYPQNKNIKAKIRQQLQLLNRMGLINHISYGRWQKVPKGDVLLR